MVWFDGLGQPKTSVSNISFWFYDCCCYWHQPRHHSRLCWLVVIAVSAGRLGIYFVCKQINGNNNFCRHAMNHLKDQNDYYIAGKTA